MSKNPFKKPLYAYLIALILVAVYFIAKLIFQEDKSIQYKSFENSSDKTLIEKSDRQEEEEEASGFILLPKKQVQSH